MGKKVWVTEMALFFTKEGDDGAITSFACVPFAHVSSARAIAAGRGQGVDVHWHSSVDHMHLNLDDCPTTPYEVVAMIAKGVTEFFSGPHEPPVVNNYVTDTDRRIADQGMGLHQTFIDNSTKTMPPMIGEQAWKKAMPKLIGEPATWSAQRHDAPIDDTYPLEHTLPNLIAPISVEGQIPADAAHLLSSGFKPGDLELEVVWPEGCLEGCRHATKSGINDVFLHDAACPNGPLNSNPAPVIVDLMANLAASVDRTKAARNPLTPELAAEAERYLNRCTCPTRQYPERVHARWCPAHFDNPRNGLPVVGDTDSSLCIEDRGCLATVHDPSCPES